MAEGEALATNSLGGNLKSPTQSCGKREFGHSVPFLGTPPGRKFTVSYQESLGLTDMRHSRIPIDMMVLGAASSFCQASQAASMMSS
jgi:hypothetical protein